MGNSEHPIRLAADDPFRPCRQHCCIIPLSEVCADAGQTRTRFLCSRTRSLPHSRVKLKWLRLTCPNASKVSVERV
jgi:hypothetical protein